MAFTYIRFNSPFAYQYLFSPFHIGTKLKPSVYHQSQTIQSKLE